MKKSRHNTKRIPALLLAGALLLSAAVGLASCRGVEPLSVDILSDRTAQSDNSSSKASSRPVSSLASSEKPSSAEAFPSSEGSSAPASVVSAVSKANSSAKQSSTAPSSKAPGSSSPSSIREIPMEEVSSVPDTPAAPAGEMKAVWISYLEFLSFAGSGESSFRSKVTQMYDESVSLGLNTVVVQVRPHGDSIYPSDYYAWSKTVSGTMGAALSYDPLAILVSEAHSRGLQIHAWVNPYRTMTDQEFAQIDSSYPTRQWYDSASRGDYMIKSSDSRWWLKPGNTEVQELIVNGIREIVQNYAVDGIHFDDYFYNEDPSYYGDTKSQARANTTALVRKCYQAIKAINANVQFGISPQGAFRENQSLPNSDLNKMSTDLALWCSASGYIDYVMPQIYWEYTHSTQPFTMTLQKWESFVTEPSVKLYVGLAPYKLDGSIIRQQALDIAASSRTTGYCLFRYDFIHNLNLK